MYEILKKKFSQNFLIDKNIINKICSEIKYENLNILEIGPGDGRLTETIFAFKPKKLLLIEIDPDLIPSLNSKFSHVKNLKIKNQDFLKIDINSHLDLIISNLPYKISSQILVKVCLLKKLPQRLIFMFQKEFADRLLDKKLNSLNSLVNCFFKVKKLFNVSKNCFRPIPKVNSSVLLFDKKDNTLLSEMEVSKYIEFKRNIFSHKRKTLKNLLKNYDTLRNDIDLTLRIEEINLSQLIKIFREVNL